jgi:hypothetical protein
VVSLFLAPRSLARRGLDRRCYPTRETLQHREPEGERRALAREGMDVDRPQVALNDPVAHREASPVPDGLVV